MKKKIKLLLKIALTIAALYYVLSSIDLDMLLSSLKGANYLWLFLSFIFFNLSKIASSYRLNIYFKEIGLNLSEKFNLALYYVGMFYNLFLPGGIGGDGYKIYILHKNFKASLKPLFQAIFLDRVSGLSVLLLYATLLYLFSDYISVFEFSYYLAVVVLISIFPLSYFAIKLLFKRFLEIFLSTTIWSLLVQLLQLISAWMILRSLGVDSMQIEYLTLFLISSVAAILPVSIGGVGIRELTLFYGLNLLGEEPAVGVAFSFLFFTVTLISSLIGLFFINRLVPKNRASNNLNN